MVARIGQGGGLNCTLSYQRGGVWDSYRLRCTVLAHGVVQVANESRGPEQRVFYPHDRAPAKFSMTFALMERVPEKEGSGFFSEYQRFNLWMRNYMRYLLDQDEVAGSLSVKSAMHVSVPVRRFTRYAIPLGPLTFGQHVGSMVWNQSINFEPVEEPGDIKKLKSSTFDYNGTDKDKNARFFYPNDEVQLSGNDKPTTYDTVTVTPFGELAGTGLDTSGVPASEVNSAVLGQISPRQADGRTRPRQQDRRLIQ